MNNRANIMYFVDQHADVNIKEGGHAPYVDFLRRDISRIVDAVAVNGANVKVCRRVVAGLGEKKVLAADEVAAIERSLREREEQWSRLLADGETAKVIEEREAAVGSSGSGRKRTGIDRERERAQRKVDKRAIEQRIEEDRERNKRLRESMWAVAGDDDEEVDKMWDEGSYVTQEDFDIANEEAEERGRWWHMNEAHPTGSA
ncbi:hypothetical protein DV735_g1698, partial [Chaetothyriales sp. CBS 134920]